MVPELDTDVFRHLAARAHPLALRALAPVSREMNKIVTAERAARRANYHWIIVGGSKTSMVERERDGVLDLKYDDACLSVEAVDGSNVGIPDLPVGLDEASAAVLTDGRLFVAGTAWCTFQIFELDMNLNSWIPLTIPRLRICASVATDGTRLFVVPPYEYDCPEDSPDIHSVRSDFPIEVMDIYSPPTGAWDSRSSTLPLDNDVDKVPLALSTCNSLTLLGWAREDHFTDTTTHACVAGSTNFPRLPDLGPDATMRWSGTVVANDLAIVVYDGAIYAARPCASPDNGEWKYVGDSHGSCPILAPTVAAVELDGVKSVLVMQPYTREEGNCVAGPESIGCKAASIASIEAKLDDKNAPNVVWREVGEDEIAAPRVGCAAVRVPRYSCRWAERVASEFRPSPGSLSGSSAVRLSAPKSSDSGIDGQNCPRPRARETERTRGGTSGTCGSRSPGRGYI